MLSRHMNEKWGATYPLATGDRLYAQDIIRDRRFFEEYGGLIVQIANKNFSDNLILSGLWCTQGAGHTMNITAGKALVKFNVKIPDQSAAWAIPPTMDDIDIMKITELAAQTNLSLAGIDTGGVNHNYAKLKYIETDGNTRARAKASGTYAYETYPDAVITFGTAAATAYEVVLAEFTSDGATLTFINNGTRQYMGKGREDVTIYTQVDFNTVVERVSANRYQFKTGITSIFFKALSGGYLMSGVLSGGDTYGYLETNGVTRWIMEGGASIHFGDTAGYVKVNTTGCMLDGVYVQGTGSGAAAVVYSFLTAAERVTYRNCSTNNRYTNVDFSAFDGGSYKSSSFNNCKVDTLKCATAAKILNAFKNCINMNHSYIENWTITNGIIRAVESCENITGLYVYNLTTANALTVIYTSDLISCFDINTITGTAGQTTRGTYSCNKISSGVIQNITNGIITGVYQGSQIQDIECLNFTNSSTDTCKAYVSCTGIVNCKASTITANNAGCIGFDGCSFAVSCYALTIVSTTGAQGSGFDTCTEISLCYATACDLDGFVSCAGVVNCKSNSNGTYGFATCTGMYMNSAFTNGTKDYHTCKVDRSGAIAVSADTVASGCNDGTNYD